MLKGSCASKGVTRAWRKVHNMELHNFTHHQILEGQKKSIFEAEEGERERER
jgi:hypothetical protein